MTPLNERIRAQVATEGPMTVADYMALCLFHPQLGYYTTREPFGAAGDFTTAPEISQMFGELIGAWLASAWLDAERPMPVTVAEIGPGRGTLMKDILRVLQRLDRDLFSSAHFAMIETSSRLTEIQKETLSGIDANVVWQNSIETLPDFPLFIIGNELFDAIPMRQFVFSGGKWKERVVGLDENGALRFAAGAGSLDPALLPADADKAEDGAIFEIAPARNNLMSGIAERIARSGGAGLFIDYGYRETALGDTFQALRKHDYEDVLASPGEADLTSHVDFSMLATSAEAQGLATKLTTQGEFLLSMGLLERAGALGANADEATRERLRGEVERLAGPDAMGELFKVLEISRKSR
ncbi:class I SAM-dependent methyltransferase [Mesorhizobium sp. SB112]|uniref:class I SAM-dependent methyltransferase n=2 Tax=Pseudomonadota TaxID=1224 RepID=UPI003267A19F